MLAFSNDYYGFIFRATQSVELFCAYNGDAFNRLKPINKRADFSTLKHYLQILLERYAYSEIGGTFILIWRYAFSTQNGTFFLYYCDVTIIHHSAKEELLCTTTILFLES